MSDETTVINATMIIAYSPSHKQHVLLRNGVVVFEGDTIIHVGKTYSGSVDNQIEGAGKLVAPGFINAHAEIKYGTLMRSYMEDLAARNFYNEVLYEYWVMPTTAFQPTKEEAKVIAELALLDLLRSGCTTIAEMGAAYRVGVEELVNMLQAVGVRMYLGGSTSSGSWSLRPAGNQLRYEWKEDHGFESLKRDINLIKKYHGTANGQIHVMFGVGALDLCVPELLQEIRKQATELEVGIQAIVGETVTEFREILRRYGKTPMELLHDLKFLGADTILVHGLVTSEHPYTGYPGGGKDLQIIAEAGASIAETAWTYLRGGRWLHTHAKYQQVGINMAVGTAGFPQDILVETQAAILASKLIEGSTYATTAIDGYNAATLNGAQALGRSDLGRIAVGAKADLLIFNLHSRRMSPVRDPIKNIIYSATSEDIETVIIDGKPVVQQGRVKNLDEAQLARKIQEIAEKFWEAIPRADYAKRTIDELAPLSLPLWEP